MLSPAGVFSFGIFSFVRTKEKCMAESGRLIPRPIRTKEKCTTDGGRLIPRPIRTKEKCMTLPERKSKTPLGRSKEKRMTVPPHSLMLRSMILTTW